jgi:hypothetical protein
MKCEACLGMIDELIEGELDESLSREATAHIAMCGPCSQVYANLRYERELYGKYLLDVEPPATLWATLRLELEKEKVIRASHPQRRPERRLGIAFGGLYVTPQMATALVLITIGLAIGIVVWRTTKDTSRHQAQNPGLVGAQPSSEANREGTHSEADITDRQRLANDKERKTEPPSIGSGEKGNGIQVSTAGRAVRRKIGSPTVLTVEQVALNAEQQYLSAIEILSRDIKRRRAVISPALLSQLETALAEVDRNIAATRMAAREQPRDPFAVQYLALAYEEKIELLREVTSR